MFGERKNATAIIERGSSAESRRECADCAQIGRHARSVPTVVRLFSGLRQSAGVFLFPSGLDVFEAFAGGFQYCVQSAYRLETA